MSELIVVLVGAAAAFLLWRLAKPRGEPVDDLYALAVPGFGHSGGSLGSDIYHWPALGRFDFEIVDTERHQAVLLASLAEMGPLCMATLHAGKDVGGRVEVRVSDQRVGFLSDGDATRFQRRLAYESSPGQTSQCGARIVAQTDAVRPALTILLDLKPFRH